MRKTLAVISVLAMVLVGFMAMASPVAADECNGEDGWFWKTAVSACGGFTNDAVPVGTFVGWILTIHVDNIFSEDMTEVVIKDRLGGELMVCQECPDIPDPLLSQGDLDITTKGKTQKVFLEWDVGTIPSGESAELMLVMATDFNPGVNKNYPDGHQEYTSTGCYELNSGATIKYRDPEGKQHSESTESIWINVVIPPIPP